MRLPKRPPKSSLVALGVLCSLAALACGPEFVQLLDDRPATLAASIEYDFPSALRRLARVPAGMKAASAPALAASAAQADPSRAPFDPIVADAGSAAAAGASRAQVKQIRAMRAAADGDAAFALGAGLPDALRLYTAGAVDFQSVGDPDPERDGKCFDDDTDAFCKELHRERRAAMHKAIPRFEAVLALPPDKARARAAWAAFAIGRAQHRLHAPDAAVAAFRRVRQLVAQGASDPLQLAAESLGEEGRVELERGQLGRAAGLYEGQVALGVPGAVISVRAVAERAYAHPERFRAAVADPQLRRVLVAYALAHGDDVDEAEAMAPPAAASAPAAATSVASTGPGASSASAAATASAGLAASTVPTASTAPTASAASPAAPSSTAASAPAVASPVPAASAATASATAASSTPAGAATPSAFAPEHHGPTAAQRRLGALLDALAAQAKPGAPLEDADRLAALAYHGGRYELAARFADASRSALAAWVQAKLALRRGDATRAAALYAQALHATQAQADDDLSPDQRDRLAAEHGTMQLARGEFAAALAQWWAVGGHYWEDLAYVAERVVTTDELKAFVDAHVPAGLPVTPLIEDDEVVAHQPDPGGRLRDLLARRLMRDGRMDEALRYFHAPDPRWRDPDLRRHAEDYRDALLDIDHAWTRIGRARYRFRAAVMLRRYGLDLVGYELAPDNQLMDADFEMPFSPPDTGPNHAAPAVPIVPVSPAELARLRATAPHPDLRFHYRYLAADLAAKAADDLPPRSQAFAAVLCRASAWTVRADDPGISSAYYRRYLKQGAVVDWATHFGHDCPEPSFARAGWMAARHDLRVWRRAHKPLAYGLAGVAVAGVVAGAVVFVRRRRARAAGAPDGASSGG